MSYYTMAFMGMAPLQPAGRDHGPRRWRAWTVMMNGAVVLLARHGLQRGCRRYGARFGPSTARWAFCRQRKEYSNERRKTVLNLMRVTQPS